MSDSALVSVIIPAYNAARTIGETLLSVRSQTHRRLEILVIDDGSTDTTADIVREHAVLDPRIRLVQRENGGVAAARNQGIEEARAEFLAFIDADDLWSPDKIERQLALLMREGPPVALSYSGFSMIDEASRIIRTICPTHEGDVLEALFLSNFVGNGSSILVTKAALVEVGGFDPGLKAQRAQGCEDVLLYFRVAERYHFAVIPEQLTGYRVTTTNMSSDIPQMYRSYLLVSDEMHRKYPQHRKKISLGRTYFIFWALERAIVERQLRVIPKFGAMLVLRDVRLAARLLVKRPAHAVARRLRAARGGFRPTPIERPCFIVGEPDRGGDPIRRVV